MVFTLWAAFTALNVVTGCAAESGGSRTAATNSLPPDMVEDAAPRPLPDGAQSDGSPPYDAILRADASASPHDSFVAHPDLATEPTADAEQRPQDALQRPDLPAPDADLPIDALQRPDLPAPDADLPVDALQRPDLPEPDADLPIDALHRPDLPDIERWPDAVSAPEGRLSVIADGRLLAWGEAIDRTTGPAGLDAPVHIEVQVVWRGQGALDTADAPEAWLSDPFFAWTEAPPTELQPEVPVTLRLQANPQGVAEGGHRRARLAITDAEGTPRMEVELHAAISPPLRMVFSGDNGMTLISDDYGRTLDPVIPPEATNRTMGPTTWGRGRFFRAMQDGVGWESPGLYETSPDGIVWTRSVANPAFRSDFCQFAFDRFACTRGDVMTWSVGGDVIVHEATRFGGMIQGLAFDGSRLYAVGRGGRRAYSDDGLTLVDVNPHPEAQWYNSVAAADGRIVAAGGNDRWIVSVSTDRGQTWRDSELCRTQYGTVWSVGTVAGRWLLSGTSGNDGVCGASIALSDDGENFVFPPGRDETMGLRFLGTHAGWLFAMRNHRTRSIVRTRDGQNWESVHALPANTTVRSMALEGLPRPPPPEDVEAPPVEVPVEVPAARCAGRLTLGYDNRLVESGDASPLATVPAWSAEHRFTVSLRNECDEPVFLLGDPAQWLAGEGWSIAVLPPVRLAPGEEAPFVLAFSPGESGLETAILTLPHSSGGPLVRPLSVEVALPLPVVLYGPGRRITMTTDAGLTFPVDGWESADEHDDTLQRGGCHGPNGFVTVGGNDVRATWQSLDGLSWQTSDDRDGWIGGCAGSPEMYVVAGGAGALSRSFDGLAWTRTNDDFGPHLRDVAYGDGAFVAVGAGRTSTTFDGNGWAIQTQTDAVALNRIGFAYTRDGTPTFVAAGDAGWIGTSTDHGATWLYQQVGAGSFGRVLFAGGRFLLGNGVALHASVDGFAWTLVGATNVSPLAAAGRLVIGARGNALWRSTDAGQTWTETRTAGPGPGYLGGIVQGGQ